MKKLDFCINDYLPTSHVLLLLISFDFTSYFISQDEVIIEEISLLCL